MNNEVPQSRREGIAVNSCTMFIFAVLVTSLALVANESVFLVCSTWLKAGLMVHIMAVRAFPPSEDCSIRVSFESLYGMWPHLFTPLQKKNLWDNQSHAHVQKITKHWKSPQLSLKSTFLFGMPLMSRDFHAHRWVSYQDSVRVYVCVCVNWSFPC